MKKAVFTISLLGLSGLLSMCPTSSAAQEVPVGTFVEYQIAEPGLAADVAAGNSFVAWYRYPAEERNWLTMNSATAYTRDLLVGGQTFISNAVDGETWHADGTRPDGMHLTWGTIRFLASYNGNSNCFVSPWWVICGVRNLYMLWYTDAQCRPDGQWTMNFYYNGGLFHTGQFTLMPRIPPNKVPLLNQVAYTDAYDSICHTQNQRDVFACDGRVNEVAWTIKQKGCAMTSEAMVLGYHGVNVDPATLNTWLINNNGYDKMGNVYWDAVSRYALSQGTTVAYRGSSGSLDSEVCRYGPQIISVKNKGHWVVGTGQNEQKTTRLINDPNGGVSTTLEARYNNTFGQLRKFGGPEYTYTDMTGIVIRFHSPGELVIADPLGRMTGFDPLSGNSYAEIPGAGYGLIGLEDDETGTPGPLTHELDIRQPLAGDYKLDVIGTGSGTYDLEINTYDPELNPSQKTFLGVPIVPGAVHSYDFDYTKTVGGGVDVGGGFDGGGQRPRDVNKFLSYGSPGKTSTTLPAGATSYSVMIFYGDAVIPESFSAVLNRVDISASFHPAPGSAEAVPLSLQPGRNVLVLSIEGQLPRRVATDTDRLVFLVQ